MQALLIAFALWQTLRTVVVVSVLAEPRFPQFSYEVAGRQEQEVSKYYPSPFQVSPPTSEVHHYHHHHHHHVYHHYLTNEEKAAFLVEEQCEVVPNGIDEQPIQNELPTSVQTLTTFSSSQTVSTPSWQQNYASNVIAPIDPPIITPNSTDPPVLKFPESMGDDSMENSLYAFPSGAGKAIFLNSECMPVDFRMRLEEFLKMYCDVGEDNPIQFGIATRRSCSKDTLVDDLAAFGKCQEHRSALDKDSQEFQAFGDSCFQWDPFSTFDVENGLPSGWSLFPESSEDVLLCSPQHIASKANEDSWNKPKTNPSQVKKFVTPISNGKDIAFHFSHPDPDSFSQKIYDEQLSYLENDSAIELLSGVGLSGTFPIRSLNLMELRIRQKPEQVHQNLFFVDALDAEKTIKSVMKHSINSFANMLRGGLEKVGILRTENKPKLGVPLFIFRDKAELRHLVNRLLLPSPLYTRTLHSQLDLLFVSTIARDLNSVPFSCMVQRGGEAAIVTPPASQSLETLESAFSSEFVDYSKVLFSVFKPIQGPLPMEHGLHDLPTSTAMLLIVPEYLMSELISETGLTWLKYPELLEHEGLQSPINGIFLDLSPLVEENGHRFPEDPPESRSRKIPYLEIFIGVFCILGVVGVVKIVYELVFSISKIKNFFQQLFGRSVPTTVVTPPEESTQKSSSGRTKEQTIPNDNIIPIPARGRAQSDVSKSIDNGKLFRQFDEKSLKVLGVGSFGVVFRVQHSVEPQKPMYAIKAHIAEMTNDVKFAKQKHSREVDAYTAISSKQVVRYFTWWFEELSHLPEFVRQNLDLRRRKTKREASSILDGASSDRKIFGQRHCGGSDILFCDNSSSAQIPLLQKLEPPSDEPPSDEPPSDVPKRVKESSKENIVEIEPVYLLIQMEYFPGDTLREWLRGEGRSQNLETQKTQLKEVLGLKEEKPFPEKGHLCEKKAFYGVELFYFYQIVKGLRDIHEAKYVHRDLKPENIYVNFDKWSLKIGDFGLAKKILETTQEGRNPAMSGDGANDVEMGEQSTCVGTPVYSAPEPIASFKSDVYSTSLILLELLSPRFHTEMERIKVFDNFKKNLEVPAWIQEIPELHGLLLKMGQKEPDKRPTANEVLEEITGWQIWDRFFEGHLCVCVKNKNVEF